MSVPSAVHPNLHESPLAQKERASSTALPFSVIDNRRWLALHLSWPLPRRRLILTQMWPLASQLLAEGLVDRFFFIRYNEGGPHLRLRLRIAEDAGPQIVERILHRAGRAAVEVEGLLVEPHPFELEVERYGGHPHFSYSLEFFALSSLGAIDFYQAYGKRAKDRQLPAILARLLWQASGLAANAEEFTSLLDYYAGFSHRFAAAVERADDVFEKNPGGLRALFEHGIASLLETEPTAARSAFENALLFSTAIGRLGAARRSSVMGSQMHMTANRLGLRNPEETYATRLLSKMVADQEGAPWWRRIEEARQRGLEAQSDVDFDKIFQARLTRLAGEKQ